MCACVYVCVRARAYAFVHVEGLFACCWFGTFAFSPASTSQLQGTTVTTDRFCFVIVVAGDSTYASGQPDPNNHTQTILITILFG